MRRRRSSVCSSRSTAKTRRRHGSDQPDGRMYANSPSPPRRKMLGYGHYARRGPHGGHMRRREFIAGTAATAALSFAWPARAQTNARSPGVKRLAIFHPSEPPEGMTSNGRYKAYFDELNRLGYIEGQNLIVERYSAPRPALDRYGDLARQIVASHPDVILPVSITIIREIKALATGIPMVGPTGDPVAFGLSTNLARPDGNFTGVVVDAGLEIWAKRVQLLLETARKLTKVGYLMQPTPLHLSPASVGQCIRPRSRTASWHQSGLCRCRRKL